MHGHMNVKNRREDFATERIKPLCRLRRRDTEGSEGRLDLHAVSSLVTVMKIITDKIFLVPWYRFERLEAGILSTRSELHPLCGVLISFYVCLQSDFAVLLCNWYVSLLLKRFCHRSQIERTFRYYLKRYNNFVANKHDILQLTN
jgi:hypothetical protein